MAVIAVQPFVLKNVTLKVDADNYERHVSTVTFTPTSQTVTWQGLVPDAQFEESTTPTWVCTLEFAQDWTTTNSLSEYLFENAGLKKTVIFEPLGATPADMPIFTAELSIVPGPVGGAVNTVQAGSVSMASTKPVLTRTV